MFGIQRRERKGVGREGVEFPQPKKEEISVDSFSTPSRCPGQVAGVKWLHGIPQDVGFLSLGTLKQQSYMISRGPMDYKWQYI